MYFAEEFLPRLISCPCVLRISHELWEDLTTGETLPRVLTIQPKDIGKPDWFRKVGEPYDP